MGGLRPRRTPWQDAARAVAAEVESFLASGYGPGGGRKLMDEAGPVVLPASAALRELRPGDAALRPYKDLVTSVARLGDQATVSGLLAAGIVRRCIDSGARPGAWVEGIQFARRQVMATLRTARTGRSAADLVAGAARTLQPAVPCLMDGLVARGAAIDLDAIGIVVEADATPAWGRGVLLPDADHRGLQAQESGVLCIRGWRVVPPDGAAAAWRMSRVDAAHAESQARERVLARILELGVGVVICTDAFDEETAERLRARQVAVAADIGKDRVRRIAAATGATIEPDPLRADARSLGRATGRRRVRERGFWLEGSQPADTWVVPGRGFEIAGVEAEAEQLLRTAGSVLAADASANALPGGGRWQAAAADALRRSGDAAPGHAPIVIAAVADAFDAVLRALVANTGGDPLDQRLLPDAEAMWDSSACVLRAVAAAFDAAAQQLRIDDRFDKAPSDPAAMRGGTGPAGSPKGLPGDVPPLM